MFVVEFELVLRAIISNFFHLPIIIDWCLCNAISTVLKWCPLLYQGIVKNLKDFVVSQ